MARTIKKIAHDLTPLSDAITELSTIISQLLNAVKPNVSFNDDISYKYFDECTEASEKLALSSMLIRKYLEDVENEAKNEVIENH